MAEGESATYADIIEEFSISAIFPPNLPPNLPPNDQLRQADFLHFPSCVRVVLFSCGQDHWLAARFLSRLSLYFERRLFQLYETHFNPV